MVTIKSNKNKLYSYLIILLGLFILVLFTKGQFERMQILSDEKSMAESNLEVARDKVDRLNSLQARYNQNPEIVDKYITDFSEDEMIDYVYSEIEKGNSGAENGLAQVRSFTVKEASINELGFMESSITVNLRVPSEERLKQILDFFVSPESKYKFFVESFVMPINPSSAGFNVTIPLKIFYK